MLEVPVFDESGKQIGSEQIDPAALGGQVNASLLKQATVMYHANLRQGTVAQQTRAEVVGSTRKLYRQKGTGRARMGNARTAIRRGGGRAFPRKPRDFRQAMPKKMRRLARNQAVLAKIEGRSAAIIDGLKFDEPRTSRFAKVLKSVEASRGCVFAVHGRDANLLKSCRNIPRAEMRDIADLNAFDVLSRPKLLFTREAFAAFRDGLAAPAKVDG
jgi:large subunit ribosomal protein L4